jgi:hypothetical protein
MSRIGPSTSLARFTVSEAHRAETELWMTRYLAPATVLCAALLLVDCGGASAQGQAANVTQAIYNDNLRGVTSHLERGVSSTVTSSQVRELSSKMHALGAYQGLKPGNYNGLQVGIAPKGSNEYVYQASFTKGTMFVVVKLAPDGKLLAYRVMP